MAPIRRYLRISQYSVLECRIYLDNPALAHTWLLNPREPMLPKVIESIRPYVLPKLDEEKEMAKGSKKKRKGIKDVVVQDEFEVSMFLKETPTRHSLLTKHKTFKENKGKLRSNSNKLTGTTDAPIEVADEEAPTLRLEEDDDEVAIQDIPDIAEGREDGSRGSGQQTASGTRSLRKRRREGTDEDQGLFVSDSDASEGDDEDAERHTSSSAKRQKSSGQSAFAGGRGGDDKKKLGFETSYDGFALYGYILCLVVHRRGDKAATGKATVTELPNSGKALMEGWVASTQVGHNDEGV
ncbi:hypothetical protein L228DRAFT_259466 [Xylona heveae TC161]|uniref:Uncharacterized protein n=1 Tax=Xylona heveae (strain CBS 132557 / TC161) TaxID=1328760 RepID=A0A161TPP6_XYLHT|nr:hypothetical protein L228DRAFT_259466 [Xylona heveae TC161]KZF24216.1 hypothetical protein L228DRAFT_259466 [Xylona heveae TC161]